MVPTLSMSQRPSLLLVLLVVLPLSLLAWLGTYLARDATRRTERTMEMLQDRKFASVDPGLIREMRAYSKTMEQHTLLPVYLAVGSGSVLVLVLGWLIFRESTRAMREAQGRVSFVNHVSHELKTPLTNIQLYAEMALDRVEAAEDEKGVRYLKVITAETARLTRLINNVLNLARKQRTRLTVQPQEAVLDEVVKGALAHWTTLLEGRGVALEVDLRAPEVVRFDPDAVVQILGNLLSNVEKYAAEGQWVRIATEADVGWVRLIVEDRGKGIPASQREKVFEAFERVRSDLTEGVSGTGIGLTISRELAVLHGGSLVLDGNSKAGARFIVNLPSNPI